VTVNYCPPVTQAGNTGGADAAARMAAAFQVSPNPALSSAVITYSGTEQSTFTVQLRNRYGAAIGKTRTFTGNTYTLDLANVTPGAYLVQITDVKSGSSCVKQLVKL
ncbi:MAG: T9SS type A sorting domain-containing protein, partial [Sphingobacteriales bacterium]